MAHIRDMTNDVTQEELKRRLNYDPETGIFRWADVQRGYSKGSIAGSPEKKGYIGIKVGKRTYKAHRLAWLYMTGEWPEQFLDHINGIKGDNRWSNLRQANGSENQFNHRVRSDNTSGIKGVSWSKRRRAWVCSVAIKGKSKYLGQARSLEEARIKVMNGRVMMHGEFANHG